MKTIPLTRGMEAMVDDADYPLLICLKWYAFKNLNNYYPRNRTVLNMHQLLMPVDLPLMIDHIDGNGLNNQRSNLRIVTATQNCRNRKKRSTSFSKYKGLYFYPRDSKWGAAIVVSGKREWLGYFTNEIDGAKAYDVAAKKYFGEYAKLNFNEEVPSGL